MSFKDKIEDYISETFADTNALTQWLTQGAKHITDLLSEDRIKKFAQAVDVNPVSGLDVSGYRPVYIHVNGYNARFIEGGMKAVCQDADSIHYATPRSPVYYFDSGKLFVLPEGANGTLSAMAYPTVLYSDSTITLFPSELEDAVVLYASIRAKINLTNALSKTISDISSVSYTNFINAMTDEDIELAQSHLEKVKTEIGEHSGSVSKIINQVEANLKSIDNLKDLYKEELSKL